MTARTLPPNVVRVQFGRDDDDEPTPPAGGAAVPRPAVRVHLARQRVAA